jgi:hypothetical protein
MYYYDYVVQAQHHDLMEAAAKSSLAAQIKRHHGRRPAIRRLARLRAKRITA